MKRPEEKEKYCQKGLQMIKVSGELSQGVKRSTLTHLVWKVPH